VAAPRRITIGRELTFSRLGFGALHLSGPGIWGPPADRAGANAVLHRAIDLGVEFIDTADTYGGSEDAIAEALHPYPPHLVVATKGGLEREGPEHGEFTPWTRNCRPEQLRRACESSLRRLRLDCIELYQLHSPDPKVPLAESLGALTDLQREGKVRHLGISNVTSEELDVALECADLVSVQNTYSVANREHEPVLEKCARDDLAFIVWHPLGEGRLPRGVPLLEEIGQRYGATASQVAIAWLLQHSPQIVPIPGTASLAHLEENLGAAALVLEEGDVARLDAFA
jgi:aryl-alcohol dehydrogenase-like predicted oxidoreductase